MKVKAVSIILTICFVSFNAYSYGPDGHAWVGAVAQFLLEKRDPQAAQKARDLLGGIDLYDAANIPDRIKTWDKKPPSDPASYHLPRQYADIERQLIDFWQANPPTNGNSRPNHHNYHYTDISIFDQAYADNETGASRFDIVHMIPFCIAVLQNKTSDANQFKITKPVALILLAHYLGDLHQPLHVGADYFNSGSQVNPDANNHQGSPDEGGNTINLRLADGQSFKLHGFWDGEAVNAALERVRGELQNSPDEVARIRSELQADMHHRELKNAVAVAAQYFADSEPQGWKPTAGTIDKWAANWATEILPVAAEAHRRLKFGNIHIGSSGMASATAVEIQAAGQPSYRDWSGGVAENEIHLGGWRLAYLLGQIFG